MKLKPSLVAWFGLFLYILSSCKQTKEVDVSHIPVQLNTVRYDRALFQINKADVKEGALALAKKYPDFTELYLMQLQGWGSLCDTCSTTFGAIQHFLTYKDYVGLNDTIQAKFPDTKKIDDELVDLLKHYKYYFSNAVVPSVYYFNSGLNNWGCVTLDDSIVGIGLDMYLGEQYPYYASVQIPQYKFHQLTPNNISVDVARSLYRNKYPFTPDGKTLLELMIEKGKEQYFIDKMLPNKLSHYKMGYTTEQLEWCEKNEYLIYSFFTSNKLLYNSDLQQVFRFVTDGPNTMGMTPQSPGNIGSWLGLRIVEAYVKNNPTTLLELLNNKMPANQFLQKSNYKP